MEAVLLPHEPQYAGPGVYVCPHCQGTFVNDTGKPSECSGRLLAEVLRLRAEAAVKPPLHVILDRPSDYPEHPVARLALERDDLRRRLMEAESRWQEGEPPEGAFAWPHGDLVWREEGGHAVAVRMIVKHSGARGFQWLSGRPSGWHLWGTARWAPIARPT